MLVQDEPHLEAAESHSQQQFQHPEWRSGNNNRKCKALWIFSSHYRLFVVLASDGPIQRHGLGKLHPREQSSISRLLLAALRWHHERAGRGRRRKVGLRRSRKLLRAQRTDETAVPDAYNQFQVLQVDARALVKRQAVPEASDADDGVRRQRSHVWVHPPPVSFLKAELAAFGGRVEDAST